MEQTNAQPLFETSLPFYRVSVYPHKVVYRYGLLKKETVVPMSQVASVHFGDLSGKFIIETSGGKEVKMVVKRSDCHALSDAINEARTAGSR